MGRCVGHPEALNEDRALLDNNLLDGLEDD
jgi:hypothetical protein